MVVLGQMGGPVGNNTWEWGSEQGPQGKGAQAEQELLGLGSGTACHLVNWVTQVFLAGRRHGVHLSALKFPILNHQVVLGQERKQNLFSTLTFSDSAGVVTS